MRFPLFAVAALAVSSLAAHADTVLYNQPYNGAAGFDSEGSASRQADDFSLASTAIINRVSFWGGYTGTAPATSQFTLNVFSSSNNLPGTLLDSAAVTATRTDTGSNYYGYEIYQFSANIPDFLATGGTSYFFQTSGLSSGNEFFWSSGSGGDGTHVVYNNASQSYMRVPYYDLAFTLYGTSPVTGVTPEPSSFALLGTGLLGIAGVVRKRFA